MVNKIILPAVLSGMVAAFLLSVLQQFFVTPFILQAETYEAAAEALPHSHRHEQAETENAWQPENGWQRTLATVGSNSVLAIGFALMLTGIYSLRANLTLWQGLAWGWAGFTVFFAAPALGLPPDLPATAAAELINRQYWWLFTVFATAIGLALLFLQPNHGLRLAAVLLIAIPHLIGAPQPETPASLSPEELQSQFRHATAWVNAVFWLTLGGTSAVLFNHFSSLESDTQ